MSFVWMEIELKNSFILDILLYYFVILRKITLHNFSVPLHDQLNNFIVSTNCYHKKPFSHENANSR